MFYLCLLGRQSVGNIFHAQRDVPFDWLPLLCVDAGHLSYRSYFITDLDRSFKFQFIANVPFDRVQATIVHFNEQREQYFSTNSTFPRYHQEMITMPLRHIWRYMFKCWPLLHCHRVSVGSLSTSPGQAPRHMHCEQKAILFDYKTSKKETAKRSGQRSESLLIQWPSDLNWWASRDASSIALSGFRFDFRRKCNRPR